MSPSPKLFLVSESETKNSFGEGDIRTAISIHLTSSPASITQASCVGIAIQTELAQGSSRTDTTPYQSAISTITAGLACLGHIGLSGLEHSTLARSRRNRQHQQSTSWNRSLQYLFRNTQSMGYTDFIEQIRTAFRQKHMFPTRKVQQLLLC